MNELEKAIEKKAYKISESLGGSLGFITGAKSSEAKEYWQKGMYTEEEVFEMLMTAVGKLYTPKRVADWFEQNKKK